MFEHGTLSYHKLEREQLPLLLRLKQETWPNTHNTTIANYEDQERWFNSLDDDVHCPRTLILIARPMPRNPGFLVGSSKHLSDIVGVFKIFCINYVNGSADVAWDVFKEWRGQGYGKALVRGGVQFCIDILNLRRLNAEILAHNDASMKCAKGAHFIQEGTKRQAVYKTGKYIDSILFGYVRDQ